MNPTDLKRKYNKALRNAAAALLLALFAAVYLADMFIYREPLLLAFGAVAAALSFVFWRRLPPRPEGVPPDMEARAEALYDRAHKGAFGWLFFAFLMAAWLLFDALSLSVNNSKPQELLEFFQMHVVALELLLTAVGVQIALSRWTASLADAERHRRWRRYMWIWTGISLGYWAAALAMFAAFNTASYFSFWVAAALYGGLVLWFNLRWRSKFAFKNFTFSRVRLAVGLGAVLVLAVYLLMQRDVWLTQPYINRVPNLSDGGPDIAYDESTGVYTLTNRRDGDFRVLQLTDIHLGGSYASYTNDLKALKACFALIDHARPDLVVVTGDLSFPIGLSSFSLNNSTPTAASTSNSCRWRPSRRIEHEAREPRVWSRGSRFGNIVYFFISPAPAFQALPTCAPVA